MKKHLWVFIWLISVFCLSGKTLFGQVNSGDSLALVAIYDSLDGPNWTNDTNWKAGNVSTWANVVVANNRVTQLYLSGNNLSGTLPDAIKELDSLQYAYFSYNNITGSLPDSLYLMSELIQLGLDHNQLNGTIPEDLGKLGQLENLYLNHNLFSGAIPDSLGNAGNLRVLYLNHNGLSGAIPSHLSQLTNLEKLGVNNNQLDSIPLELGAMTSLKSLYLNANLFSGPIPDTLFKLTGLQELYLDENQFSGMIPVSIGNLVNLTILGVSGNELNGMVPDAIGNLGQLQYAYFSGNKFSAISDSVNNLFNLKALYVEDNQLHNLPEMDSLINLQELSVRLNALQFDDILPVVDIPDSVFLYSPQDSIYQQVIYNLKIGNPVTLSCYTAGNGDVYSWYLGDSLLINRTDSVVDFAGVTLSDAGIYRCLVKNSVAPDLTLKRYAIEVQVDNNVGLSETSDMAVFLYPNPVENMLKIQYNQPGLHFTLSDVQGRILLEKPLGTEGTEHLELKSLVQNSGTYFYRIEGANGALKKSGTIQVR